ncbi:AraC family transcriptional regulator [Filimonas effusa]|uniref:AraC family transcriptional regulator n=1 Tax=Filimonas effusa TaxID=2508721 RepID=A0A4Q1D5C6_9BACT|nr:AraC family transcriptional regulator [Filimonas effusa]RXK83166.1 AraC family transcriptional regulator [Filimonas effusa]
MCSMISSHHHLNQNNLLPIRIVSPGFGHLSPEVTERGELVQHLPYYFFLFVIEGFSQCSVDMKQLNVEKHELLFLMPHQVRQLPTSSHASDYYKLGFDEECLSRLPKQYPFLLNPLNRQKIHFSPAAAVRVTIIFNILSSLLGSTDADPEIILAHLNSLLTEINTTYFGSERQLSDDRLDKFIGFKVFVEENLTDHPTIRSIAEELGVSTDSLYQIVKYYSGLSPKEFLTDRLMLEARRRMHYGQKSSVKELAFELGFSDPDYFSRLFKKNTGKTVAEFFQDLS